MANQATAYWTQGVAPQQGQAAYSTQASAQPTWEEYYNWAKQLYANGDRVQGDVYYRHAQLLYEQMQAGRRNLRTASYPTASNMSPAVLPRITADISARYSAALSTMPYGVGVGIPGARTGRVKIWVLSVLLVGLGVAALGVSHVYKQQLRTRMTGVISSVGFAATWVQDATLKPTVQMMQPAAEKVMRLSLAAQPLLYELRMGDTPPKEFYLEMLKRAEASLGSSAAVVPSFNSSRGDEISRVDAPLDPANPTEASFASAAAAVQPSTVAPSDEPVAPAQGAGNSPAAAAASDAEMKKSEADEEENASSKEEAGRSHRRRSHRSRRDASQTPNADAPQANQWAEPAPGGGAATFEAVPSTGASPAFDNTPKVKNPSTFENEAPVASNPKTKELDALLAPKPKAPQASEKSPDEKPLSAAPRTLSRFEVQQGMNGVAPAVKNCGQGSGGTVSINLTIAPNGRISRAVAAGAYAGTPIGNCAERAVRGAVFPTSDQSITVKYPFAL